jgi:plastocyanin
VAKGTTVTWTWASGSSLHSVTFDDGATSATMATGSYTRTFDSTGTFPYHCKVHGASMSGRVTVE